MEKTPGGKSRDEYETRKTKYFSQFALAHLSSLRPHKEYGVLGKKARQDGWINPSKHCIVEAVMVDVVSEKLGLNQEDRNSLVNGALLHDFYKREQMRIIKEGEGSTKSLEQSELESRQILSGKGYSSGIMLVADSAADTRKMFNAYSEVKLIEKIIYYIDSITMNDQISTIEKRISTSEASNRYTRINEEARVYLGGKTQLQAMREISTKIQSELAGMLGIENPKDLPKWIEGEIKRRIDTKK